MAYSPLSPRSRLVKNVADAKLVKNLVQNCCFETYIAIFILYEKRVCIIIFEEGPHSQIISILRHRAPA